MKKFLLIPFLLLCLSAWDVNAQCTAPTPTDIMISAPGAPGASAQSSSSIRVTWTAGTGTITGYDIYRNTPGSPSTFCLVGSTNAAMLSYTDNGLTPVSSYTYRIYSKSATGFSLPTSDVTTATPVNLNAPSNLVATPVFGTTNQIQLTWADNSNNESGFQVFQTDASGSTEILVTTTSFPIYIVNGLSPNVTYYYKVKAYILNTPPAPPSFSAAALSNPATTFVSPGTPSNLVVFPIGYDSATVQWDDNSTNEVRFEIILNQQTIVVPAFPGMGRRSFQLTNLFPKSNYAIYMRAIGPGGTRAEMGSSIPFVTCPAPPPAPINPVIVSADMNSSVTIGWGAVGGFDDLKIIEIDRSNDGGATWFLLGTQNRLLQTYTDNTASGGTRYLYRVVAVNTCDYESEPSASVAFQRTAPESIYNLTATAVSDKQVDLAWGLPIEGNNNRRTAFGVWRYDGETRTTTQIATLEPFLFSYQDKTAKPKTFYIYYIQTANGIGQTKSAEVPVTTPGPPAAPTEVKATPTLNNIGNTIIALSWKDNADDEDYFSLEESVDGGAYAEITQMKPNTVAFIRIPVEEGVKYSYRIRGWNKWGFGSYSSVVDGTYDPTKAPNAPFNLKARAISAGEIQLTWLDDSNNESTFDVESSSDGRTFRKIGETKRNILTYSDKTVAEKTKVFYRVRAINAKGNSDYTNVADATTPAKTLAFASNENIIGEMSVYPNPTSDYALIKISDEVKGIKNVIVVDRNSRIVMKAVLAENQNELMLNMTTLMEGTYTISVSSDSGRMTKRVAKN
jgi:hypothetical protein